MKKTNGFSLLEVLVSASIIAILTIIGVVSYSSVNKRSRDVKRKSDLEQLRSSLEMYRTENSEYPHTANSENQFAPASDLTADLVSTYMPSIPTNPGGDEYQYQAIDTSAVFGSYCLCTNLETVADVQNTCTVTLDAAVCNYGLKNP